MFSSPLLPLPQHLLPYVGDPRPREVGVVRPRRVPHREGDERRPVEVRAKAHGALGRHERRQRRQQGRVTPLRRRCNTTFVAETLKPLKYCYN